MHSDFGWGLATGIILGYWLCLIMAIWHRRQITKINRDVADEIARAFTRLENERPISNGEKE